MNKHKKAFTLVELIVVITILAILGTIAFISLQGYSKTSRDSVRISDTSNMKTSLELFHLNAGKYPLPDDYGTLTYLSEPLYFQGYFGDNVIQNLSRNITKVPLDPLTERRYIYSVSSNKNELEILSLLEGDDVTYNPNTISPHTIFSQGEKGSYLLEQANAAGITVTPRITGNYNELFVKTSTYIVPLPSIINTEVDNNTVTEITQPIIESMVTDSGENIPTSGNVLSNTGALTGLVLTGTTIPETDADNATKAAVIEVIKSAYENETALTNDGIIGYIANLESDEIVLASAFDTTVLKKVVSITTTPPPIEITYNIATNTNCTVTDITPTKTTIITNISSYIGCEINDYEGTNIPGNGVYIAGLTDSDSEIMFIAKEEFSSTKLWGCKGTLVGANSDSNGMENTSLIVENTECSDQIGKAPKSCRDIGYNWYLPSKNELNTIYDNKLNLGTFGSTYHSSTEFSSDNVWLKSFSDGTWTNYYKDYFYYSRCASNSGIGENATGNVNIYNITTNVNCTVTDTNPTKQIIIDNISDYIGCEINDYEGTNIPGSGVYIAGLTNSDSDIMVIAKEEFSSTKLWGCKGTFVGANSDSNGMENTSLIVENTECSDQIGKAPKSCRDIGYNWYLPSKNELNTIYDNKLNLGTFGSTYHSSTEFSSDNVWLKSFSDGIWTNYYKDYFYYSRCASSF